MPRIKKQIVQVPQESQLPSIAKEVADAASELKAIEAKIEAQISKIRAQYQSKIEAAKAVIKEGTDQLEAYAITYRDLFDKRKSRDIVHGVMGFRTATPSVKLDRGLSKAIVPILESMGMEEYLRVKKELDKDAIISKREDAEIMARLAKIGIQVQQTESFYFQPKEEEVTNG